jgi:hypothetical protein
MPTVQEGRHAGEFIVGALAIKSATLRVTVDYESDGPLA